MFSPTLASRQRARTAASSIAVAPPCASVPEPAEWLTRESWSAKGDVRELPQAHEGFHPGIPHAVEVRVWSK
jgi:hypothetical protein